MKFYWLLPSFLSIFLFSLPASAARLLSWRFDTNQNRLVFNTDAGVQPKIQVLANPTRIVIDLPQTTLGQPTVNESLRGTVRSLRVGQLDAQTSRLVIELNPGYNINPQALQLRGTPQQWSLQLPTVQREQPSTVVNAIPVTNSLPSRGTVPATVAQSSIVQVPAAQLATIQSIDIGSNGTLLTIQSDRRVFPSKRWDAATGAYRITIPAAQLTDSVTGPNLSTNSPVVRVRIEELDSRTVEMIVQPAAGVQVGDANQISDRLLAFQLQRSAISTASTTVIPVPEPVIPTVPATPPPSTQPSPNLPTVRNQRVVVTIDPGHGGRDPGAVGVNGLREVDVILPISLEVASILERQGVQVQLTRNADYFVELAPRVEMARRANADLFVSIHANAIANRPDVQGLETYYFNTGRGLAQTIHNSILQSVDIRDRRVRQARFYVLRRSSMPAVLVEVGFVTSPAEAAKLASPAYRSQMAAAIARGILQYIQQNL